MMKTTTTKAKTKAKATDQPALLLKRRTASGSRATSRLRRQGFVPGVVYGKEIEAMPVTVPHRELVKVLHSRQGEHSLLRLRLEEGTPWEKPALVKDIQHDPVGGEVLHVDFQTIVLTERIKIKIPIVLLGEPVGVKQDGGVLEHFLREVEIACLPTDIPERIEFDASQLKIGETVHVRDLQAPANTELTSDPAGVIASVQKPKEEKPEEAAASVTEPEVLREKKEEAAEAGGDSKTEPADAKEKTREKTKEKESK